MFEMQTKQESTTQLKKNPNSKAVVEQSHTSPFMMNPVSVARIQNKKTAAPVTGRLPEGIVQRELVPTEQEGANCGLHAMAMVLYDLQPDDPSKSEEESQDQIKTIAEDIRKYASGETSDKHYTILGEAFDADILCRIGNEFCQKNDNMKDITLVAVNFDGKEEKLKTILDKCREKQLYVLLPYFANEKDINPCTESPGKLAESNQMDRAHWCAIERTKEKQIDGEQVSNLHALEGHTKLFNGPRQSDLNEEKINALYLSNQKLAGEFSWDAYSRNYIDIWTDPKCEKFIDIDQKLKDYEKKLKEYIKGWEKDDMKKIYIEDEVKKYENKLLKEVENAKQDKVKLNGIADKSKDNSEKARYHINKDKDPVSLSANLMENANLKGRALFIGKTDVVKAAVAEVDRPSPEEQSNGKEGSDIKVQE